MISYEQLKTFFVSHKATIVQGFSFALVFTLGFGTGEFKKNKYPQTVSNPHYYSTKSNIVTPKKTAPSKPKTTKLPKVDNDPSPSLSNTVSSIKNSTVCIVKGNISNGRKIYHVAGGVFYKTVHPEQCFKTESEAQAAGFKKSGR